jgi:capsular polysaccharide biosynthesis protein
MMTLDELLAVLWRRRTAFAITLVMIIGAAAAVTFSLARVYSSTTYLLAATTGEGQSDFEATQANQALARTYVELLRTDGTRQAVAAELPFRSTALALARAVRVSAVPQTQLVRITAEESTPSRARTVAETYARVFVRRATVVDDPSPGTTTLRVVEPAQLDTSPVRPRPRVYLTVAAVVGLLLAGTVAVVWDRWAGRRRRPLQAVAGGTGEAEPAGVPRRPEAEGSR